jgi:hypothetical protein
VPEFRFRVLYVDPGAAQARRGRPRGGRVVEVDLGSGSVAVPTRAKVERPSPPRRANQPPPIVAQLLRAIEWRRQLDAGEAPSQAAIARREGITRARVTQIMSLLRLAPTVLDQILEPTRLCRQSPQLTVRTLREIAGLSNTDEQLRLFATLSSPQP